MLGDQLETVIMMMVVMIIELSVIQFNGEDRVASVDSSNGATHDVNHRIATKRHNGNIFIQTQKNIRQRLHFAKKKGELSSIDCFNPK